MNEILIALKQCQDEKYALGQAKLVPTLPKDCFLGLKMPRLREIEREFRSSEVKNDFLKELPHRYFEENWLHALMISHTNDFSVSIQEIEAFLPFIDNWAVCDSLKPKSFNKVEPKILLSYIRRWIRSKETYTCRFGIEMLMDHFLDKNFERKQLNLVTKVKANDYYVDMMVAWYMATALAKQWDATIRVLEANLLPTWTHNKTIQKAIESFRISEEKKNYLRTLKRKRAE